MENGQIIFTAEDGSEEAFYVLEKAEIAGSVYLLVLDSPEEDGEALILKQVQDGEIVTYEILEDKNEQKIIAKYFEEILEDINLEME